MASNLLSLQIRRDRHDLFLLSNPVLANGEPVAVYSPTPLRLGGGALDTDYQELIEGGATNTAIRNYLIANNYVASGTSVADIITWLREQTVYELDGADPMGLKFGQNEEYDLTPFLNVTQGAGGRIAPLLIQGVPGYFLQVSSNGEGLVGQIKPFSNFATLPSQDQSTSVPTATAVKGRYDIALKSVALNTGVLVFRDMNDNIIASITLPTGSGGSATRNGHVIFYASGQLTQRDGLNFEAIEGITITPSDSSGNNRTTLGFKVTDGGITDAKLATDNKVGSLTALTGPSGNLSYFNGFKNSVVAALNRIATTLGIKADLVSGKVPVSQLGTGAVGDGLKVLADNQTYVDLPTGGTSITLSGSTGTSTVNGMTQKVITDNLNLPFTYKAEIVDILGSSPAYRGFPVLADALDDPDLTTGTTLKVTAPPPAATSMEIPSGVSAELGLFNYGTTGTSGTRLSLGGGTGRITGGNLLIGVSGNIGITAASGTNYEIRQTRATLTGQGLITSISTGSISWYDGVINFTPTNTSARALLTTSSGSLLFQGGLVATVTGVTAINVIEASGTSSLVVEDAVLTFSGLAKMLVQNTATLTLRRCLVLAKDLTTADTLISVGAGATLILEDTTLHCGATGVYAFAGPSSGSPGLVTLRGSTLWRGTTTGELTITDERPAPFNSSQTPFTVPILSSGALRTALMNDSNWDTNIGRYLGTTLPAFPDNSPLVYTKNGGGRVTLYLDLGSGDAARFISV